MYSDEAQQLGFDYTGIAWNKRWDEISEPKYQKEATEIKNNYKGADFRIVIGRKNNWLGEDGKAIMGNEIFNKVYKYLTENIEEKIDTLNDRKSALQKEYEEKLNKLEEEQKNNIELKKEIEQLKVK